MSVVAVASVAPVESVRVTIASATPDPAAVWTEPVIGFGVALTAMLSMRLRASVVRTRAASKVTPPIVQLTLMCLPLCACTWSVNAFRMLIAVLGWPPPIAACSAVTLEVSALATPVLSMQAATTSWPITSEIAGLLTVTVTDTTDEWLMPSKVPVTVSVNVVGVTIGDRCRVRVELALPPDGGVTELGLKVTDTPAGAPEALSATAELKPLTELTVTAVEAVPPTETVTGLIRPIEKSTTATWNVPVLEFPAGSVAVQVTVVAPAGNVEPEDGLQLMVRVEVALSGSVAPTANVTTAPLALVATAVMSAGRLRVGAVLSSTTTVAVAVPVLPAASVAEQVMVVVPSGKVLPEAGEHVGVSEPDTASVAVAA